MNTRDHSGQKQLQLAVEGCSGDIMELLLEFCAHTDDLTVNNVHSLLRSCRGADTRDAVLLRESLTQRRLIATNPGSTVLLDLQLEGSALRLICLLRLVLSLL